MKILVVVKSDTTYRKIRSQFSQHEITENIPHFQSLQDFVLSDDANLAVIEDSLHWKGRADSLLREYKIPYVLFKGNFDELAAQIKAGQTDSVTVESAAAAAEPVPMPAEPAAAASVPAAETKKAAEAPKVVIKEVIREVQVPVIQEVEVIREVEKIVEREVIRETPVEVIREVESYKILPRRSVVIGSLYPGAGSTFSALSLARVLNYLGIPNAVVESPVNQPELFSLLYGDEKAPQEGYAFLADLIEEYGHVPKGIPEWTLGVTTWYPANNKKPEQRKMWNYELTVKMINAVKSPIVLYDVSHHWENESVKNICLDADMIVFVLDTFPSKAEREETLRNAQFLAELKAKGKAVHVLANRDVESSSAKRKEWLHSLPLIPSVLHPNLDYEQIIHAVWEGELVQDRPEILQQLLVSCYPLIRGLVPPSYPLAPLIKKEQTGFLSRLFRRKQEV